MIYRLIEATNVIANVQDTFNIDESDWIGRSANWINKALSDLGVISELHVQKFETTATDYRVELPCAIKALEAVEVEGKRVYRTAPIQGVVSPEAGEEVGILVHSELSYRVQGDNYIEFETNNDIYKEVKTIIYYKSLPQTLWTAYGIYIPMIPDIDIVQDAISNYIMIKILGRGYKHQVFSLNSNNPATNPYIAYYGIPGAMGLRKRARIKIKSMDKDARERVSVSTRSLNHPDRHHTLDFNNEK